MKKVPQPKYSPGNLIKSSNLFPVVGIGASAGGLEAFKKLLKAIPQDSGVAFVLVQHLDPNHESVLPELLQKVTAIPVLEISDKIRVEPNHIYVIPSNKMMVANDGILKLAPRPPKSKTQLNLPIDLFFASLAEVHQSHAIGVVLSGTGSDGTIGLKAIKDHGGITFAQDEASASYDGMPNSAVQANVVDFILPPEKIPQKLLEVTKIISTPAIEEALPLADEEAFKQINSVLHIRKGTDFTYYKQTTVRRRILRRMAINKNEEPATYLKYLRENKPEQDVLYQDLLIPVTSFFRDPKTFASLCESVFPLIIKNKQPGETIRVWVAGCSTGEEAYSIAICFKEFLRALPDASTGKATSASEERVQIFATDLSEPAIVKARTGIYSKIDVAGVSPQRLSDFFTKSNGSYQVNRQVRDMCVFAHHNFLKDPPFSKLDLISCRNVLIYMEPYLQKKALTTFHYALIPNGFLLLGKSETIGGVPELYTSVAKNEKLYARKDAASRFMQVVSPRTELNLSNTGNKPKIETMRSDFQKMADDIMLSKYTPAGVVVNEAMEIVQFRGTTSTYLEQSPGKPSHNLLVMAKYGLAFELRNILHKVKKEKVQIIKENVPVQVSGTLRNITIEAIPLPNTIEPHYLILFHNSDSKGAKAPVVEGKKSKTKATGNDKDARIRQLEQELAQTREDMRSITEDQEAANEELQSANEELLSGSEELQSLNEELETSKEELQSTNEELMVVNHELIGMNEQATEAREFANAIISNLHEPLLVLDKDLRVKIANNSFYKTFLVNEAETEERRIYELGNHQWDIPALRTLLEKILPEKSIFDGFEVTHKFESIGERIMVLNAREIVREAKGEKLILLAVEDITEKRAAAKRIEESEKQLQNIFSSAPVAISVVEGPEFKYVMVNPASLKYVGRTAAQLLGKTIKESFPLVEAQGMLQVFDQVYSTGHSVVVNEMLLMLDYLNDGVLSEHYVNYSAEAIKGADGKTHSILCVAIDVTQQVLSRKKIEENKNQLQSIFRNAPAAIAILEGHEYKFVLANKAYEKLTNRKAEDLLGKKMIDVFPELEAVTLELFDKVFETGESYSNHEHGLMLDLKNEGVLRQCYFSFSMEPLKNDSGEIYALITMSYDISEQVEGRKKVEESEKQKAFLLKLSDAIKELVDPVDIQLTACRILGEHVKVNRVVYGEVIDEQQIILNNNYVNGVAPIIATLDAEQFGRHVIDAFKRNEKVIISDITTDPGYTEEEKQNFLSLNVVANAGMGLLKGGRWVATFGMHYNAPRKWTAREIWLMEETAERTWAAVERARAEQALRHSEEKYRTLFTSIDQGFALCEIVRDKEGKGIDYYVREVNPTYEKQAGISKEMMVGKTIREVFPAIDKWWIETYAAVADNQQQTEFEKYFEFTQRWYEIKAYPGEKDKVVVLFNDITERKQTEEKIKESEKQFRELAELMPQKVWTADVEGNKNYFNQKWLDYSGLPSEELKGEGWQKLMHPDDREKNLKKWQESVQSGKDYEMECRLLRKDGQYLWHLTRAIALKDAEGKIKLWIGSKTEIQEQRVHQEMLEKAIHERTYSLNEANQGLKEKNEELVRMNQELQAFAYVSSHDLQEPLRKIRIFSDMILDRENQNLTKNGQNYFRLMNKSAERMQALIHDLLTFSRVSIGERKFEKVKLYEMVVEVKAEYKHQMDEMRAAVAVEGSCEVHVIRFQLLQILSNLISNSLKFSKPGIPPHITITCHPVKWGNELSEKLSPHKEYNHITFTDNGIGFENEFKEKIFEVFQRLHSKDKYAGTGMGLAIVKKIVDNHHGLITATSELNKSTTFELYIPITQ